MKNIILALATGLVLSTLLAINSQSIHADLSDNLIRLHVIADSDSEEDQRVKLKVRDRILREMSECFEGAESPEECKSIVRENMGKIIECANDELEKNGFDYTARVYFGHFDFPVKQYKNIILPAGNYEAVRVVLGTGSGQNWWCVMYPPLCFVDEARGEMREEDKKVLEENLSEESYDIITADNGELDVEVRFKILELFGE